MGEIIQLPVKKTTKPRRQRTRVLAAIPLPDDKSGAELSWPVSYTHLTLPTSDLV